MNECQCFKRLNENDVVDVEVIYLVTNNTGAVSKSKGHAFHNNTSPRRSNSCVDSVAFGRHVRGVDVGNGFVKVGHRYLPTHADGKRVLVRVDAQRRPTVGDCVEILDTANTRHSFKQSIGMQLVIRVDHKDAMPYALVEGNDDGWLLEKDVSLVSELEGGPNVTPRSDNMLPLAERRTVVTPRHEEEAAAQSIHAAEEMLAVAESVGDVDLLREAIRTSEWAGLSYDKTRACRASLAMALAQEKVELERQKC